MSRSYLKTWELRLRCSDCGAFATFRGLDKSLADFSARSSGWSLGKAERCLACKAKRRKTGRGDVR